MFRSDIAGAVMGAAALALVATTTADAQSDRVQAGTLECSLSSSIGMVVGSQRNVACNFKPNGGPPEAYVGTLSRVGLDVGVTGGGAIIWGVFSSTNLYSGMLTGTYVGATAEMSIAAGLGANVLVGGSNRAVALQPVSVQGQVGLNIAAGVGTLELHLAK
jgi:Protein of unknown function (DUF992)